MLDAGPGTSGGHASPSDSIIAIREPPDDARSVEMRLRLRTGADADQAELVGVKSDRAQVR